MFPSPEARRRTANETSTDRSEKKMWQIKEIESTIKLITFLKIRLIMLITFSRGKESISGTKKISSPYVLQTLKR